MGFCSLPGLSGPRQCSSTCIVQRLIKQLYVHVCRNLADFAKGVCLHQDRGNKLIRQMCRKGVLFFIRDPTERSYNPVKDILERPTVSQMRKVGLS